MTEAAPRQLAASLCTPLSTRLPPRLHKSNSSVNFDASGERVSSIKASKATFSRTTLSSFRVNSARCSTSHLRFARIDLSSVTNQPQDGGVDILMEILRKCNRGGEMGFGCSMQTSLQLHANAVFLYQRSAGFKLLIVWNAEYSWTLAEIFTWPCMCVFRRRFNEMIMSAQDSRWRLFDSKWPTRTHAWSHLSSFNVKSNMYLGTVIYLSIDWLYDDINVVSCCTAIIFLRGLKKYLSISQSVSLSVSIYMHVSVCIGKWVMTVVSWS